jgi:hypothetical protein
MTPDLCSRYPFAIGSMAAPLCAREARGHRWFTINKLSGARRPKTGSLFQTLDDLCGRKG